MRSSAIHVDPEAATAVQRPHIQAPLKRSTARQKTLRLLFYEMTAHPEDRRLWSGTPAHIVEGLRNQGVPTTCVAAAPRWLYRLPSSSLWHYYRLVRGQNFIPDRHPVINRVFSAMGSQRVGAHPDVDAIVTSTVAGAAHLRTKLPVFIIHDATWAQMMEMHPWFHAAAQPQYMVKSGWELERKAFRHPNHYLVLASEWARNRAIADHGLDPDRVFTAPLGANFSQDPPDAIVNRAIAARRGEHCNLLFVAVEFEKKGGPIAVAAAEALRSMGIPTTLHIAGCSPTGLPDWVQVYGYLRKDRPEELSRLQALYAQSDFFILPTRAEAQGIVFNEAAGFGLPAAGTDVGGVSTVVRNGDWGKLLPLDANGSEYAAWIAPLFRDRLRYRDAAHRARQDFVARLSRSAYTRRLLEIIHEVLEKKSTHA